MTTHLTPEKRAAELKQKFYISLKEKTFDNDDKLPSLPVPSLHQTLEKYLDSVRPHVTESEFTTSKEIVAQFENGIGRELHEKLVQHSKKSRNWLEQWWCDVSYLSLRLPLAPYLNTGCVLGSGVYATSEKRGSRIEKAALFLYYQMEFWRLLRKEQMKPHYIRNVPWSMDQWKRLFNVCRIVGKDKDTLQCKFQTEAEGASAPTHIIVLHRGHIFSMELLDEQGEIIRPPELEVQLRYIEEQCNTLAEGDGVGSLTLLDRPSWFREKERLCRLHPNNQRCLDIIQSALAGVVFDDSTPQTPSERISTCVAKDPKNRWADLTINMFAFDDGVFACSADHAGIDGFVSISFFHFIQLCAEENGGTWKGSTDIRQLPMPERLQFVLDDHLKLAMDSARSAFTLSGNNLEYVVQSFVQYGKQFIKTHNVHPEAYVSLSIQLAYYKKHGHPAPIYITAPVRQFYRGRTETCRGCFPEGVDWMKAMLEGKLSEKQRWQMFQVAADKWNRLMSEGRQLQGCDRHLLGLQMVAQEEGLPTPEIFLDPSWKKSGGDANFVLSTSCLGYTDLCGITAPMCENGYCVIYSIEDNKINFSICAYKHHPLTSGKSLFENIEQALCDLKQLAAMSKLSML